MATVSVQATSEMDSHYYRPGYPLLTFLYGLYCDPDWSQEAFEKWDESGYEWEGYLDPYPNLPHGARQVITVDVPALPRGANQRVNPTAALCNKNWPYLLQELTVVANTAKPYAHRAQPSAIRFNAMRPVLSSLALIYLTNELPQQAALYAALADPRFSGVSAEGVWAALTTILEARPNYDTVAFQVSALRQALDIEFTTGTFVW